MVEPPNDERRFTGLAISGGVAVGRVCLFRDRGRHPSLRVHHVPPAEAGRERERLDRAVAIVTGRLDALRQVVADRVGPAEAEIFAAQRDILKDPVLLSRMTAVVAEEGYTAEAAVKKVLEAYESKLREVEHEYLRERASDIGELARRLLDALLNTQPSFLCEAEGTCRRGLDRIVVTQELTPALSVELDARSVRALVTERGGVASHAAILARAVGIPAVSGIPNIHNLVGCGTELLVDGTAGEVVVWPSPETAAKALGAAAAARPRSAKPAAQGEAKPVAVEPVPGLAVMANISLAAEAGEARAMIADGVGLYRTEFEFLAAGRVLVEEEQADRYASVLEAMAGRPVYVRLLDIGGDKPSPLFDIPDEANPQLGCRGARYLLSRPDLLRTQARALARASRRGPVHVMYPMVIEAGQLAALRREFERAVEGLPCGRLAHGAMFEVPSACLDAAAILKISDFASIGSNDLIQYLFAVDRNNDRVAYDYFPDREVFWRVVEDLVRAARTAGKPLSLCGELAAEPRYVARLIRAGLRTLSVSVRHIPAVRRAASEALMSRRPLCASQPPSLPSKGRR